MNGLLLPDPRVASEATWEERILVVEDHAAQGDLLVRWLRADRGADVTVVRSAEEAIDLLDGDSWDLVITDFELPGLSGLAVSAAVKEHDGQTPVIMVTVHDRVDVAVDALRSNVDDFLMKPLGRADLTTRATRLLDERKAAVLDSWGRVESSAEAWDQTVEGWARVLDLRDHETEGHSRRVTEITTRLGEEFGFAGQSMIDLRRGALLHDIGKMGVPDAVLLKTGPLSHAERDLIELHPVYGRQLLGPIPVLRPALDVVYYHHERWDGSGYPEGRAGEDIPQAARLFAIADVWDALTSDRPYREAWSNGRTMDYLLRERGRHFDPGVVDVFMHLLDESTEWGAIRGGAPVDGAQVVSEIGRRQSGRRNSEVQT